MKQKFLWKLFASFTLVLFVCLVILYASLASWLKNFQLVGLENTLRDEARLIMEHVEDMGSASSNTTHADELADRLGGDIGSRVTIIDGSGRVLGDSKLSAKEIAEAENHISRPEIVGARSGEYGVSTRHSTSIRENMMYLALKTSHGFVRVAIPTHAIDRTVNRVRHSVLLSAIAALFAASVISFAMSRTISRPVKAVLEATKKIESGNFTARLYLARRDEFGIIAESINSMAEGLEAQFRELKRTSARLSAILDGTTEGILVTDRVMNLELANTAACRMLSIENGAFHRPLIESVRIDKIYDTIKSALGGAPHAGTEFRTGAGTDVIIHSAPLVDDGAVSGSVSIFHDITGIRKLERMRRDFVANISHELKTPITNIRGYSETLAAGALADRKVAESFLAKIESNAIHLQQLVEGMLGLSRLESGNFELQKKKVFLRQCAGDVLSGFETLLHKKNISATVSIDAAMSITADEDAVKQALGNLIENAIIYNNVGGRIGVSATAAGARCRVTVEDTGIGIADADVPHIFERFYRSTCSRDVNAAGTGLGLAIAKHIILAHGGEIGVESDSGKGTKFWFTV